VHNRPFLVLRTGRCFNWLGGAFYASDLWFDLLNRTQRLTPIRVAPLSAIICKASRAGVAHLRTGSCSIALACAVFAVVCGLRANAQDQHSKSSFFNQSYEDAVAQARQKCNELWSDHLPRPVVGRGTIFLLSTPRVMSALPPKANIGGAQWDVLKCQKQTHAPQQLMGA
jgi:hypothetical protein